MKVKFVPFCFPSEVLLHGMSFFRRQKCQFLAENIIIMHVCVQAGSTDPSQQPPVTITVSEEEGCTVSNNGRKPRAIPCCCLKFVLYIV